jgi:hypothetical protein
MTTWCITPLEHLIKNELNKNIIAEVKSSIISLFKEGQLSIGLAPTRVTRSVCEKIAQKCRPTHFLSKLIHDICLGMKKVHRTKMCETSVIFKKSAHT